MSRLTVGLLVVGLVWGVHAWVKGTPSETVALAASGGTISGRVVLNGDAPAPAKLKVTKDNEKCGAEKVSEELIVSSDRGIKNAVVSVASVKGATGNKTATIDQKGCVFNPHVAVVAAGGSVDILNNDGILHNFHTHSAKNPTINKAQPGFKKKMTESFAQAEVIKINCDAHPWMTGWVFVSDNPAVATGDGGNFKIENVPPGEHTVEVWHETLGKITKKISVKAGEEAKLTIELAKK